jgi:hypothetical protein
MRVVDYMDIDDMENWDGKYKIGDMLVDSFASEDTVSYIFRIEYQPDSKMYYYWLRYTNDRMRDTYFTEEELDEMIENAKPDVKHYPVKK